MANVKLGTSKEDVNSRFELCLIASKRAKDVLSGAPTSHDKSDKPSIIALDEIAAGELDIAKIRETISAGDNAYQSNIIEETEDDNKTLTDKDNIFVNENLSVID
jgi:DNA-directed RNA polymerase omega subunit